MASISESFRGRQSSSSPWRQVMGLIGFLLLIVTLLLVAILVSYNRNDPSLNHAIDTLPTNLLGMRGAVIADLLVQTFGAAALLLPVILFDWSIRLLIGRGLKRFWLRLLLLPSLLILAAVALSIVPPPSIWPAKAGLSGLIGGIALHYFDRFGAAAPLAAMSAAALVGLTLLYVMGFASERVETEESDEEERRTVEEEEEGEAESRQMFAGTRSAWSNVLVRLRERRQETAELLRREPVLDGANTGYEAFDEDEEPETVPAPRKPRRTVDVVPAKPGMRRAEPARQSMLDLGPADRHLLPPLELLTEPPKSTKTATVNEEALQQNARLLESVLEDFGVRGQIVMVRPGPVVTLYELEPAPGIKASRIIGLADDIARSMSSGEISARTARLRNLRAHLGAAHLGARQGYRWRARGRRSRAHAASPDRRHDRLRQIRGHQHHDSVAALSAAAGAVPLHHDRSENAGTLDV